MASHRTITNHSFEPYLTDFSFLFCFPSIFSDATHLGQYFSALVIHGRPDACTRVAQTNAGHQEIISSLRYDYNVYSEGDVLHSWKANPTRCESSCISDTSTHRNADRKGLCNNPFGCDYYGELSSHAEVTPVEALCV